MNKIQKIVIETLKDSHIDHWITHIDQYHKDPDIFDDFAREILMDFDAIKTVKDGHDFINSVLNKEFENESDRGDIYCYDDIECMVHQGDAVYAKYNSLTKDLEKEHNI